MPVPLLRIHFVCVIMAVEASDDSYTYASFNAFKEVGNPYKETRGARTHMRVVTHTEESGDAYKERSGPRTHFRVATHTYPSGDASTPSREVSGDASRHASRGTNREASGARTHFRVATHTDASGGASRVASGGASRVASGDASREASGDAYTESTSLLERKAPNGIYNRHKR